MSSPTRKMHSSMSNTFYTMGESPQRLLMSNYNQYILVGHKSLGNDYDGMHLIETREVKTGCLNVLEWLSKK